MTFKRARLSREVGCCATIDGEDNMARQEHITFPVLQAEASHLAASLGGAGQAGDADGGDSPPAAAAGAPAQRAARSSLLADEAEYFRRLDEFDLQETDDISRQTTPAGSRAASPLAGPPAGQALRAVAPGQAAPQQMDGAAPQQQQHVAVEAAPGSEDIRRHFPDVAARWVQYREWAQNQQLVPLRLSEFFSSCEPALHDVPVL